MDRIERDQIGEMPISSDELRGIHTLRAESNFRIAGRPASARLFRAYGLVKKACAVTNKDLGFLDADLAAAISTACDEVASGAHDELFRVDALQGGAGTSTNMCANEVIANRATQILASNYDGDQSPRCDPLAHVNLHQSTNDTYPTALKVCLIGMLRETAAAAERLQGALQGKEREFAGVVTVGRTELQNAVPMTLGAVFSGLAEAAGRDRWRTFKCEERLRQVNLGGTAVGTGLAAPRDFIFRATDALRSLTGYGLSRAENLVDQTANGDSLAETAGILSAMACDLEKIANDLRLLARDGDILLPAVQAGSSIMPGKVNPVICEAVIQAGMKTRSLCALAAETVARGSLQINEFLPLTADSLIEALGILTRGADTLAEHVKGIHADAESCKRRLDDDRMIVTAFLPILGYDGASALLERFDARADRSINVRRFLESELGAEEVSRTLSPAALSSLGFSGHGPLPHVKGDTP
ncbi:MAG TPA: lyase family protein [Treponemataceae bacterium]|nr:lyase family protein [Treponemataceae bacterium]